MRSRALFVVCVSAIAITSLTKAQSASFLHLNPGGLSDLPETVPVNIVFVGYESSLVNQSSFLSALPGTTTRATPIVRIRQVRTCFSTTRLPLARLATEAGTTRPCCSTT